MQTFEKTLIVSAGDLDELNHVNNVRYVQWIQDISKEHWQSVASPEMKEGVIWVVLNHNITYKSAAVLNDCVKVHTNIAESRGAISVRIVEMYNDKTNQLLVRSNTEWCLLNTKTLKPIRIPQAIKQLFLEKDG